MKKPVTSLFWKTVCYLIIAGLLLLGLIGLILPVIPGILFLFLALLLLTRVSGRAAAWAENHHWFRKQNRLWQRAGTMSVVDRLKLGLLMGVSAVIRGMHGLFSLLGRSLSGTNNPR